jgi:hypothetical protein
MNTWHREDEPFRWIRTAMMSGSSMSDQAYRWLRPPAGIAAQFMGALYLSHYLWVIFAFQLIAGVLLLVNRYVPLAVAVLAPVIVNILTFHVLMGP